MDDIKIMQQDDYSEENKPNPCSDLFTHMALNILLFFLKAKIIHSSKLLKCRLAIKAKEVYTVGISVNGGFWSVCSYFVICVMDTMSNNIISMLL